MKAPPQIPPADSEAQLKKYVVVFVGCFVLLLTVGGIVFSLRQPQLLEKYWIVATPLISTALSAMIVWRRAR